MKPKTPGYYWWWSTDFRPDDEIVKVIKDGSGVLWFKRFNDEYKKVEDTSTYDWGDEVRC